MTVNEERLKRDLRAIDASEAKIKPLSTYMQLNISDARKCSRLWMSAMEDGSREIMVPLLYLCNEVVQTTKTNRDYVTEFAKYLEAAFSIAVRKSPRQKEELEKLLRLWQERSIYSRSFMDRVRAAMTDALPVGGDIAVEHSTQEALSVRERTAGIDELEGADEAAGIDVDERVDADPALAGLTAVFGAGEDDHKSPGAGFTKAGQGRSQQVPLVWPATDGPESVQPAASWPPQAQAQQEIAPVPPFLDVGADALRCGSLLDVLRDMRRRHAVGLSLRALTATIRPEWTKAQAEVGDTEWEAEAGLAAARVYPERIPVLLEEISGAEKAARLSLACALLTQSRVTVSSSRLTTALEDTATALGRLHDEADAYKASVHAWAHLLAAQSAGNTIRIDVPLAAPGRMIPFSIVERGMPAPTAVRHHVGSPTYSVESHPATAGASASASGGVEGEYVPGSYSGPRSMAVAARQGSVQPGSPHSHGFAAPHAVHVSHGGAALPHEYNPVHEHAPRAVGRKWPRQGGEGGEGEGERERGEYVPSSMRPAGTHTEPVHAKRAGAASPASCAAPAPPPAIGDPYARARAARQAVEQSGLQLMDFASTERGEAGDEDEDSEQDTSEIGSNSSAPVFRFDVTGGSSGTKVWDPVHKVWVEEDARAGVDVHDAWRA